MSNFSNLISNSTRIFINLKTLTKKTQIKSRVIL